MRKRKILPQYRNRRNKLRLACLFSAVLFLASGHSAGLTMMLSIYSGGSGIFILSFLASIVAIVSAIAGAIRPTVRNCILLVWLGIIGAFWHLFMVAMNMMGLGPHSWRGGDELLLGIVSLMALAVSPFAILFVHDKLPPDGVDHDND